MKLRIRLRKKISGFPNRSGIICRTIGREFLNKVQRVTGHRKKACIEQHTRNIKYLHQKNSFSFISFGYNWIGFLCLSNVEKKQEFRLITEHSIASGGENMILFKSGLLIIPYAIKFKGDTISKKSKEILRKVLVSISTARN